MKYKILRDYGSEGFKFDDGEFDDESSAIKHAVAQNYCTPFCIVVIYWKPELKK